MLKIMAHAPFCAGNITYTLAHISARAFVVSCQFIQGRLLTEFKKITKPKNYSVSPFYFIPSKAKNHF
jgi:hypothetical protein